MNETDLDDTLVEDFEAGTLAPGTFHHRDHVRLTWIYLQRYGRREAEQRLLAGLRAFAARAGKPEKFDAALTCRWVALIDDARVAESATSFDALVAARPELLETATASR